MRGRIDAQREAADDDDAGPRQVRRQLFSDGLAIRRRLPRAHDRGPRALRRRPPAAGAELGGFRPQRLEGGSRALRGCGARGSASEPSRSATVRATLQARWNPRAVSPRCSDQRSSVRREAGSRAASLRRRAGFSWALRQPCRSICRRRAATTLSRTAAEPSPVGSDARRFQLHAAHANLQVDPVEKWAGEPALVGIDRARRAAAASQRIPGPSAGARIGSGYQGEMRRVRHRAP